MRAAVTSRVRKGSRRRFDREENKKCACAFRVSFRQFIYAPYM
jgi:hypothetical protein